MKAAFEIVSFRFGSVYFEPIHKQKQPYAKQPKTNRSNQMFVRFSGAF